MNIIRTQQYIILFTKVLNCKLLCGTMTLLYERVKVNLQHFIIITKYGIQLYRTTLSHANTIMEYLAILHADTSLSIVKKCSE